MSTAKHKLFKAGAKKYLLLMLGMYLLYTVVMLYGLAIYRKIPSFDPMRMPYLYVLLGAGAILLVSTLSGLLLNIGKKITITPQSLIYEHGSKYFSVSWKEVTFKPPEKEGGIYRSVLISDGKQFGTFDDLFFKEYDFMLEIISMAKDNRSSAVMNV